MSGLMQPGLLASQDRQVLGFLLPNSWCTEKGLGQVFTPQHLWAGAWLWLYLSWLTSPGYVQ